MCAAKVAINGFGRIGRHFLRAAVSRKSPLDIVAINDLAQTEMLAHLLEYDTVHGRFDAEVKPVGDHLQVDERLIRVLSASHPATLPWRRLGVDLVVECTGRFTARERAAGHLVAGASHVVVSAATNSADTTVCVGINDHVFDPRVHRVISNGSCTTQCVAVMASVLHERFGIVHGWMTAVHAYTNDQELLDLLHYDMRRARAAAHNIVPTRTGAADALGDVIPSLAGRIDGVAVRVPVPDGSLADLTCRLATEVTTEEVNRAFAEAAAAGPLRSVLGYTEAPVVSSDVIGDSRSCVFSASDTVTRGDEVKVFGWYDNEWGYANRLLDLAELVAGSI